MTKSKMTNKTKTTSEGDYRDSTKITREGAGHLGQQLGFHRHQFILVMGSFLWPAPRTSSFAAPGASTCG